MKETATARFEAREGEEGVCACCSLTGRLFHNIAPL